MMNAMHDSPHGDLGIDLSGNVATVEIRRPPHNFFDQPLIAAVADAFEALDADPRCRAIVLAAAGKTFCAGADFSRPEPLARVDGQPARALQPHLYGEAHRLFRLRKPIIAAVQGAAVGGGLGLALAADFRVTCPEARFWANFSRLGLHAGFGITATLPRILGPQRAALLLYTGRRISGTEAVDIGLADVLTTLVDVRARAVSLAAEIAEAAPLAVMSMRRTLRRGLADAVERATERELVEQTWLRDTDDFKEGVKAMSEKRSPRFDGR
jgi:enoyl-CoA hydratase/carnithine racemase